MPIRVLDAATVGRIAAGEVVERPASIAKELIENAMDAGATAVTVEIRDGGVNYLRVTDNGCGIAPNEVRMAFENHATSKIASGDALSDIRTLGFRGEALPSIAAVSRVTMTTRMRGQDAGCRISLEGGRVTELCDAGCPQGTTLVVKDLFFNTPVRREFLKKPSTEGGVVADLVAKMILGNPGVSIRLISAGRTVYHSYGDGDVRHAALTVYGRETASQLLAIDEAEGALRLSGLIGVGDQARSNRGHQFFFINGRVVRCPQLTQALEEAVRGRVMIGSYPMCALSLTLPANSVDINVHPSKLEVRFRDETLVRERAYALIVRALDQGKMLNLQRIEEEKRDALPRNTVRVEAPTPQPDKPDPSIPPARHAAEERSAQGGQTPSLRPDCAPAQASGVLREDPSPALQWTRSAPPPMTWSAPDKPASAREKPVQQVIPEALVRPAPPSPAASSGVTVPSALQVGELRILGVFANTYIVVDAGDTLLLIDQHAAHERLLYERFVKALSQGHASQQLLVPVTLELSPSECDELMRNRHTLLEAGYEVEPFGERSVRVTAVPHVLGQADMRMLFMELLGQLSQLKSATEERRRAEIIQASCKHAVKGGDSLSSEEVLALVEQMLRTDAPSTCPHGRPVYKAFTRREIERMFKRIV